MNVFPVGRIACVLSLLTVLAGCSDKRTPEPSGSDQDPVLQERLAKDAFFKSDADSPIPSGERIGFSGLSYYPINPALKFQLRLRRYDRPQPVRLGTNTGEIRGGLLYGYFEFQVAGRNCRLQVYRLEETSDRGPSLFIPFRDATSGKETYGAGRYLEFSENTTGMYDLDFNRAYNPYCAYNAAYSCPLPPAENTLPVPIRAGEKKFRAGSGSTASSDSGSAAPDGKEAFRVSGLVL